MTLSEQINTDLKAAMKSGDKTRLNTLRLLRAHFIELSKRGEGQTITPEEELSVLMTAMKKRKEAIEIYEKGGRLDLAQQERAESDIISSYLPKQLSPEETAEIINRIIGETGASTPKDFGKVMPLAMKELKGKVDGKLVQELVKSKLGG
ncbi:MAG TPA: glutamyl-tRNA amidotransferase [Bacteroidetes bacterium]|nr:MAG: glutamyl-tRNA amidotransferase [Ignavibacteria bacterium GWA2_54_16]HCA80298.1 glutamyl-tRNA amidotransferase [Bacteroidota bacterium]